jgi:hypothetical protein
MAVWYILWSLGIFFPVLVCFSESNLATLPGIGLYDRIKGYGRNKETELSEKLRILFLSHYDGKFYFNSLSPCLQREDEEGEDDQGCQIFWENIPNCHR